MQSEKDGKTKNEWEKGYAAAETEKFFLD